jgi:hypothetical protein
MHGLQTLRHDGRASPAQDARPASPGAAWGEGADPEGCLGLSRRPVVTCLSDDGGLAETEPEGPRQSADN